MDVIVNSKGEAWELIKNVTEVNRSYCYKSEENSSHLGYDVYLFGVSGASRINGRISDFVDRLEVKYVNGKSMNIWIKEQPEKENMINVSLEELLLLSYALQKVIVEDGSDTKKEELSRKLLEMACEKTKK